MSDQSLPVTLGKPSLRRRLEAYYSLVSPETIANEKIWMDKFDLIYSKYGGSVKGELKLMKKLHYKYGGQIRLLVAADTTIDARPNNETSISIGDKYELKLLEEGGSQRVGSGILDFTSTNFDPFAALYANIDVTKVVPDASAPILDNIHKARVLLPEDDPLRLDVVSLQHQKKNQHNNISQKSNDKTQTTTETATKQKQPYFHSLTFKFATPCPLKLLHTCQTQNIRVCVLVRYVNCIRGTLKGYIVVFDKHFNMILRDVDEYYSPRYNNNNNNSEKLLNIEEVEWVRRICSSRYEYTESSSSDDETNILTAVEPYNTWNHKERHCKQLLVRGDIVVSVWKADDERSNTDNNHKSKKTIIRSAGFVR